MTRTIRIEYPGAIYHVMNRRNRREAIFENGKDRTRFLETLERACLEAVGVGPARDERAGKDWTGEEGEEGNDRKIEMDCRLIENGEHSERRQALP